MFFWTRWLPKEIKIALRIVFVIIGLIGLIAVLTDCTFSPDSSSSTQTRARATSAVINPTQIASTSTSTATTLSPTVTPSPTAIPVEHSLSELRIYMLDLVNEIRAEHDLEPLTLGDNDAAQQHAEASLAGNYNSHWDMNGMTPRMRYTLAGGFQNNQENILRNACSKCAPDPKETVREAISSWLNSPGHRKEILRPEHKKLNVGLAWGYKTPTYWVFNAVQQFEGDYISFSTMPNIDDDGYLSLAGTLKSGATLSEDSDLGVYVHYHQPPSPLTLGQLERVSGVNYGLYVAKLRPPLPEGRAYGSQTSVVENTMRVSPYDIDPDLPHAANATERRAFHESAVAAPSLIVETTRHRITADRWEITNVDFDVRADLSVVLDEYGPGCYDVTVWAMLDDEQVVVSEYTVFWPS